MGWLLSFPRVIAVNFIVLLLLLLFTTIISFLYFSFLFRSTVHLFCWSSPLLLSLLLILPLISSLLVSYLSTLLLLYVLSRFLIIIITAAPATISLTLSHSITVASLMAYPTSIISSTINTATPNRCAHFTVYEKVLNHRERDLKRK